MFGSWVFGVGVGGDDWEEQALSLSFLIFKRGS